MNNKDNFIKQLSQMTPQQISHLVFSKGKPPKLIKAITKNY